jgi:hypothetical protein
VTKGVGGQVALVHRLRHDSPALVSIAALLAAGTLWGLALTRVDPDRMTDTGLVSVLPWTGALALLSLALGFGSALLSRRRPRWLLIGYPLALTVLLYATPPLVYGSARYSWTWKHAGIVDFIARTGGVDPDIDVLSVYHNWPGFFAFNAMLTDLTGLESSLSYAAWAELFFSLLTVATATALLRTLSEDNRTVALGAWLFVLGNWVGQGYFAPQAINLIWYLLVVIILLRWLRGRRARDLPDAAGTTPRRRVLLMAVVLLLVYAIVTTHQFTPLVLVPVLAALALTGRTSARVLPVFAACAFVAWVFIGAAPYTRGELGEMLESLGALNANVEGSLIEYGGASDGQVLVSLVTRALTAVVGLLGAAGILVSLRRGERRLSAIVLATTPFLIIAVSAYGNEIVFRAYLFALVALALFGALLLWRPGAPPTLGRVTVVTLLSLGLLVGTVVAQFGHDNAYRFAPGEIAAAEFVYETAPANSLLVEGSRDYPSQFRYYEKFTYVAIDREPEEGVRRVVAHPARTLRDWLENERYEAGYVIITRSQIAQTEALGLLPKGGLRRVDRRLRASSWFQPVFQAPGATVYVLDPTPGPGAGR